MKTYPMFAIIEDKPCLVVGGGAVGERKVKDLLAAGAQVHLVSRELTSALIELADQGRIRYLGPNFAEAHLTGMILVLAATDDPELNSRISAAAQARAIWVNVADVPEMCTFVVPAQLRRGELTLAIGTGGASPALAQKLRVELAEHFGPEYGPYLVLLGALRTQLLSARRAHPDNSRLFHALVDSPLREAVAEGDRVRIVALLQKIIGSTLSPPVLGELVSQAFQETEG